VASGRHAGGREEHERQVELPVTFQRRRQALESRLLLGGGRRSCRSDLVAEIDEMLNARSDTQCPDDGGDGRKDSADRESEAETGRGGMLSRARFSGTAHPTVRLTCPNAHTSVLSP